MGSMRLGRSRAKQNPRERRKLMVITVTVSVLLIALIVTMVFLWQSHKKMAEGRTQIEESILSDLTMLLRAYERFAEPGADIGGQLLPEITKHLYSAYSHDNMLIDLYGVGASIIGNELYSEGNAFIDTLDREIKADRIVNAGDNALTPLIEKIHEIIAQKYGEGGQNFMADTAALRAA